MVNPDGAEECAPICEDVLNIELTIHEPDKPSTPKRFDVVGILTSAVDKVVIGGVAFAALAMLQDWQFENRIAIEANQKVALIDRRLAEKSIDVIFTCATEIVELSARLEDGGSFDEANRIAFNAHAAKLTSSVSLAASISDVDSATYLATLQQSLETLEAWLFNEQRAQKENPSHTVALQISNFISALREGSE